MAKFSIDIGDWIDDDIQTYKEASQRVIGIAKASVWEGAKVTADALAKEASKHGNLANGLRISYIQGTDDGANAVIWFDGYDTDGVAFALKANALESGRSSPKGIVGKHSFIRKTINKAKAAEKAAVIEAFTSRMNKLMNK